MTQTGERNVYYNTRARALKSRLYPCSFFLEFIDHPERGPVGLVEALLGSPYRVEMAEALTRYSGADAIEEAVRRNLVENFAYLNYHAEEPLRSLMRVFTTRWDLDAVKSLMRCRLNGIESSEALPYVRLGLGLSTPMMLDLVRSPSMEVLVERLMAWNAELCRPLRRVLPEFAATNDISILEEALDRAYFVENAEALAQADDPDSITLRSYLQAEIDRINLRTIFQHLDPDTPGPALRFLPGGMLGSMRLARMSEAESAPAAMELLEGTRYSRLVEELFQFMQTRRFSPVERYFERFVIRLLKQFARRDIFGIGVPMEYAWLKYNEAVNLRLVARGLSGNVPAGRVREELFCP